MKYQELESYINSPLNNNLDNSILKLFQELLIECRKHFNNEQIDLIIKAFKCANFLHQDKLRDSGEYYITHPLSVALIALKEARYIDVSTVCACLLHDTIEDTWITKEELKSLFGEEITYLVLCVSKIDGLFASKKERDIYNDAEIFRESIKDIRVLYIKIFDRLHNMRTLMYKGSHDKIMEELKRGKKIEEISLPYDKKRIYKSSETMGLFAPLSYSLGLYIIYLELVNLCFMYLNNKNFRKINNELEVFKREYIEQYDFSNSLQDISKIFMNKGIQTHIEYKVITPYEAYIATKHNKRLDTADGIIQIDITVMNEEDCYKISELLKAYFPYAITGFNNYINSPKINGYKALHLYVNHTFLFRICTRDMKIENDFGNTKVMQQEKLKDNQFMKTLQKIIDVYNNQTESRELLASIKEELKKGITVTSPNNQTFKLPKGATALDFAFLIHTEIGLQASYAIVNGHREKLNIVLNDGDMVYIIIDENKKNQEEDTLNYVKTPYAKKAIKVALKKDMILERKKEF